MEVSPKAITAVERRWLGRTAEEYDALQARLMADGIAPETAMRLTRHLDLLNRNPRLAIDSSSGRARWLWRKILEPYRPPRRRPPRRREAGGLAPIVAVGVTTAASAAAAHRPVEAAAVAALLVITGSGSEELELAA